MKTKLIDGVMTNIYTDDEVMLVKLAWIVLHLAMPWHTFFYPRYCYDVKRGVWIT